MKLQCSGDRQTTTESKQDCSTEKSLVKGANTILPPYICCKTRRTNFLIFIPDCAFWKQLIQEDIEFLNGDVGHDNDVGHIPLASKLPTSDKLLVQRSFEHHRAAKLI